MSISADFEQTVRGIVADVVGEDVEDVSLESNFFHDLGGESIDVLDLGFHLEKRLGVRANFQQMLAPDRWEFDTDGQLTAASIRRLRDEFPHVELPADLQSIDLREIFTVAFIVETAHRAATIPDSRQRA